MSQCDYKSPFALFFHNLTVLNLFHHCISPMRKRVLSNVTSALVFVASSIFCHLNPLLENCAVAQTVHISPATYSTRINPLVPDARIRRIATRAFRQFHSNDSRIIYLFDTLKTSSQFGLRAHNVSMPSTASETSVSGGDCSDLTLAFIAAIRYMNSLGARIPYGAQIMDSGSPPLFHMVALVPFRGSVVAADLTSNTLGEIAPRTHIPSVTYAVSPNNFSPAAIYHAEWGDYFRVHRTDNPDFVRQGIAAYLRSLELYEADPFVHGNLAFLCDLVHDFQCRDFHNNRRDEIRRRY